MGIYLGCAVLSAFIQYLIMTTHRIYIEFLHELLPQVAAENRHNIQYDMIQALIESRLWRVTLLLPVAFVCTFIMLPYDIVNAWYTLHNLLKQLFQK